MPDLFVGRHCERQGLRGKTAGYEFSADTGFPEQFRSGMGQRVQIDGNGNPFIESQGEGHLSMRAAVGHVKRQIAGSQIQGETAFHGPAGAPAAAMIDLQDAGIGFMRDTNPLRQIIIPCQGDAGIESQ